MREQRRIPFPASRPKLPPPLKMTIEFSGHDDAVPAICRFRKVLKNAWRVYRLKARIVAESTPVATAGNPTGNESSGLPAGSQTAFNEADGSMTL